MQNKKGHVGRPTNEELSLRKKKKVIKILLPFALILIILVVIVGKKNLKSLMGYSGGTCELGYKYDSEKEVCYQETTSTTTIKAYLLGDADNNRVVNYEDATIMATKISQNQELTNVEKAVYNINQDTIVEKESINKNDLDAFYQKFGINQTNGKTISEIQNDAEYVCPEATETKITENEITKITTITYKIDEQNKQQCIISNTVRTEKQSDDTKGLSSSGANEDTSNNNIEDTNTPEENVQIDSNDNNEKVDEEATNNTYSIDDVTIKIDNENSTKIYNYGATFDVDVTLTVNETNNDYFYQVRKYYNEKTLSNTSNCKKIKKDKDKDHIKIGFNMIETNRKAVVTIYTDNNCTNELKKAETSLYKAQTQSVKKETKNKIDNKNITLDIIEPENKEFKKGTQVNFYTKFTLNNLEKKYYYKFSLYKDGKEVNTPPCRLVENKIKNSFKVTMNASKIYGQIEVYENNTCKGNATYTRKTSVYHALVTTNPIGCEEPYTLKKSSKGNYYCQYVKTPSYSCKAKGYSVTSYADNKDKKYCKKYVKATTSGYTYNCNGITGLNGTSSTLVNGNQCRKWSSCKKGKVKSSTCYVQSSVTAAASIYNCDKYGRDWSKIGDGPTSYCYSKNNTKPIIETKQYYCASTGKIITNKSDCLKPDNSMKQYKYVDANQVPVYTCSGIKGANGNQSTLEGNQCKLVDSVTATCDKDYILDTTSSGVKKCVRNITDNKKITCPKGYKATGEGSSLTCSKIMD